MFFVGQATFLRKVKPRSMVFRCQGDGCHGDCFHAKQKAKHHRRRWKVTKEQLLSNSDVGMQNGRL